MKIVLHMTDQAICVFAAIMRSYGCRTCQILRSESLRLMYKAYGLQSFDGMKCE